MSDPGTRYADRRQEVIERRLRRIYTEATADIVKRLDRHSQKMYANDEKKREQVAAGKLSEQEYKDWLRGQLFIEGIWKDQITEATNVLLHANEAAVRMIEGERRAVFAENANWQEYRIEKDANMSLKWGLYDDATVTRLIRDEPQLLPPKKVDEGRDTAWNRSKISAVIARGVISGDSIQTIAQNIGRETGITNEKAMTRYARTAMTAAQNAGRIEAMNEAQEMGIQVRKVWMATLDERTRPAHQDLDGKTAEINEPFSSILGPIMYPGDPSASAENTWNCRCTLTYEYADYPKQGAMRYDQEAGELVDDTTYNEWLAQKHPERVQERAKPQAQQQAQKPQVPQKFQQYEKDEHDKAFEEWDKALKEDNSAERQAQVDAEKAREEWFRLRRANAPLDQQEAARLAYEEAKAKREEANLKASQVRKEYSDKFGIEAAAEYAQKNGIPYVPLQKSAVPFDQQAVIRRVAGGDMTKGSCASLGFCYVAQKAGYDVVDFRGGESCSLFAYNCKDILKALQADGISTAVGVARSYITAGKRALANVQAGKEYYFECGRHAAIVRKVDGKLQYLELQSGRENGWKPFDGNIGHTLSWRFGAPQTSGYDVYSYMLDVDEMAKSDHLMKIMGYINTNEGEQKKGSKGHER